MNDDTGTEETETIEVDGDHPWLNSAAIMSPQPVITSVGLMPVDLPIQQEDGSEKIVDAAILNITTPVGVTTVFLSPPALVALFKNAGAILEYWKAMEANPKLVVANRAMEKEAKNYADSMKDIEKLFRNG